MSRKNNYADLVSLFKEFRELQKPKMNNGDPDYTEAAMAEQGHGLMVATRMEFGEKVAMCYVRN